MLRFLSLCISALVAPLLAASAGTIAFDSIPQRVRESNPSLAAARLRIDEARARFLGSGRLPNPEGGVEIKPNVRGREFSASISFDQKFPFTARLRLEQEVSASEVAQAEAEVREVERQLIARAQLAAIQWLSISQLSALRAEQAANAAKLAESAAGSAQKGEGSALDAGQFKLEAAQFAYEVKQISAQQTPLNGELRGLLGIGDDSPLAVSGNLSAPAAPAKPAVVVEKRPDYQAKLYEQAAADKTVELEKARKWEDISVGGVAEIERAEDAPDGLETDAFIGLRVTIPFPWWNKNEGKIQEAGARAERVRREAAALAAEIRNDAAAAHAEMLAHARLAAESSDTLLKLAEAQFNETDAAWRKGEARLAEVLRARDQLLKITTARLEAVRDYHLARIRMEAATARHSTPPAK